jgi:hypothetical protein
MIKLVTLQFWISFVGSEAMDNVAMESIIAPDAVRLLKRAITIVTHSWVGDWALARP